MITPVSMMRRGLLALLFASLLAGCGGCGSKGSGNRVTQSRPVDPFTEVRVTGIFEVELAQAAAPSLTVAADDNLLPRIQTNVAAGRLSIASEGSMLTSGAPTIVAATPALAKVIGEGTGEIRIRGASGARFEIELGGTRSVVVEGTVDELVLRLSGASKVDATKLAAKSVLLDASGASQAELASPATLVANASGSSKVRYDGAPTLTRDVSGGASVEAR